jgi:hypothetical protein
LKDRLEENPNFIVQFGDWIMEDKLADSKDVRQLPQILENQESYKKFLNSGIKDARAVLYQTNPSLVSNLYNIIDQTVSELETISLQEIQILKSGDQARLDKFKKLKKALKSLESFSGVTFD